MTRLRWSHGFTVAALTSVTALAGAALLAAPAAADTPPITGCTSCTATYNSAGESATFVVPTKIKTLTVTVSGAAGGTVPEALTSLPDPVGGSGGVTTVNLGTAYAGQTLLLGVGHVGQGSFIQTTSLLLAVAGGGGSNGYAGYLDDAPPQVFATYLGGAGGSPAGPGIAPGADGTAFPGTPVGQDANGLGGTATGGAGGTGDDPGSDGGAAMLLNPAGSTLAPGGAGGSYTDPATNVTHVGGAGGTGYTGGGGGAVATAVPAGDFPVGLVAPGGGGSGYLDASLTATAGTPNTGAASIVFHWTVTPAVLPSTGAPDPTVPFELGALLMIAGAATVISVRRRRSARG